MRSRVLAATLAVLIGSTAEVGATLIVVYRSDSEVVIAADSRGVTERGTHKDDFCKGLRRFRFRALWDSPNRRVQYLRDS